MTLFEALKDLGKGRFIDNGCSYELVSIAKGNYFFEMHDTGKIIEIKLLGKPSENARKIEQEYYKNTTHLEKFCGIRKADYKPLGFITLKKFVDIVEFLNFQYKGNYKPEVIKALARSYYDDYKNSNYSTFLEQVAEMLEDVKESGTLEDIDFYIAELKRFAEPKGGKL